MSLAFLSDERIAISDSEKLAQVLGFAEAPSGRAEWQRRFDRLAGSPFFAVLGRTPR